MPFKFKPGDYVRFTETAALAPAMLAYWQSAIMQVVSIDRSRVPAFLNLRSADGHGSIQVDRIEPAFRDFDTRVLFDYRTDRNVALALLDAYHARYDVEVILGSKATGAVTETHVGRLEERLFQFNIRMVRFTFDTLSDSLRTDRIICIKRPGPEFAGEYLYASKVYLRAQLRISSAGQPLSALPHARQSRRLTFL